VNAAAGAANLQVAFKEFGFKKISWREGSIEKHEEAHRKNLKNKNDKNKTTSKLAS